MCGVGLLHLAAEVIQKIGDNLLLQDLKLLRLVCSWLNLSVEPVVLSCVRLDVFNHAPTRTMHQLETLASQRSRASKYTRTLEIASLVPSRVHHGTLLAQCVHFLLWEPTANAVEACMRKHLSTAISSMENLESVIWTMNEHDPAWTRQSVSDSLVGLRFLQNLRLILPESMYRIPVNGLHLNQLCHLQKISLFGTCKDYRALILDGVAEAIAKSPRLAHFEVSYPFWDALPLQDFFTKRSPTAHLSFSHVALADMRFCLGVQPNLHALRSLELTNTLPSSRPVKELMASRSHLVKIYNTLAHERVFLTRIVIDDVFPALLDYLSLYCGILTELSIVYLYKPIPWGELDKLAVRFYASVLPKHVGSLELLNISPMFSCGWCFDPQHCSAFLQAECLRSLSVSFAFIPLSHTQLIRDDILDHAVSSIMQLSMSLPFLTKIKIDVSRAQRWRRSNWIPCHGNRPKALIVELDVFAHRIRFAIDNFVFPDGEETRPMIEVEARLPGWWDTAMSRKALLRMDGCSR